MSNNIKLLILFTICFFAGSNTSLAGDRTEREMLSIAHAQLCGFSNMRKAASNKEVKKLLDERAYCVYGVEPAGFVVVSRDDTRIPVLGYSDSKFDSDNLPCGLKWWLEAVSAVTTVSPRSQMARAGYTAVAPLLATRWDQGDPYNFLTPVIGENHTPTGCVATAMAQVMKYFSYPSQGKGQGYYTLSGAENRYPGEISNTYDWELMMDDYSEVVLTDEIRLPVAKLMQDAGLASHMNYSSSGSGTQTQYAALGMAYNFSYDSLAIRCFSRNFFDDAEWMSIIYDELAHGRPLLYGARDTTFGGHEFVLDGVDEEGRIHINWGWSGNGDGFFDFADLNPMTRNTMYHFNLDQDMIFGFRCNPEPTVDEKYQSLWCTSDDYSLTVQSDKNKLSVNLLTGGTYNYHFLTFYGSLGVAIESTDGHPENDRYFPATGADFGAQATFWGKGKFTLDDAYYYFMNPEFKLSAGSYRAFFASKAVQDEKPQPVRCLGGAICYRMTVDDEGIVTFSDTKEAYTGIEGVYFNDINTPVRYYDLQGREVDASHRGLVIMRQGSTSKKVIR